ncbi:MAG: DNA repair protein RadC [Bacteroidales bacterium]|nr:DNA repair protein RadC [Bacteroidales bacterium]MCF8403002.1 DNA repair protein RadC [Bacteroidales bacterium]
MAEISNPYFPIREWAEDDRPREKMLLKGSQSLSDAELIAILIGSGSRNESAVDLSKRILKSSNDNLLELSKLNVAELKKFKGIGEAKAISIIAALELGKRRRGAEALDRKKITSSRDVFEYFASIIGDSTFEAFYILLLNRANKVLRHIQISEGGVTGTVADPKKIFKMALENNATSIILCHNHPSGSVNPSTQDITLTKKLKNAGDMLDIPVLDHLIIGEEKYYSFADENMM